MASHVQLLHGLPTIGTVDVAGTQCALLQHPEVVQQKERMGAGAAEVTVPDGPLLLPMLWAEQAVDVEHDVLQPRSVVEPVDPLTAQIGERRAFSAVTNPSASNRFICDVDAA